MFIIVLYVVVPVEVTVPVASFVNLLNDVVSVVFIVLVLVTFSNVSFALRLSVPLFVTVVNSVVPVVVILALFVKFVTVVKPFNVALPLFMKDEISVVLSDVISESSLVRRVVIVSVPRRFNVLLFVNSLIMFVLLVVTIPVFKMLELIVESVIFISPALFMLLAIVLLPMITKTLFKLTIPFLLSIAISLLLNITLFIVEVAYLLFDLIANVPFSIVRFSIANSVLFSKSKPEY